MMKSLLHKPFSDLGLLGMRLFFGITMALAHGWPKLQGFDHMKERFPDPFGVGSLTSLLMVLFAELICAFAVAAGWLFRPLLIPLIVTMVVAAFVIHGNDPFQKQELSLVYLAAYVSLFLTGPGRYSLDAALSARGGRR